MASGRSFLTGLDSDSETHRGAAAQRSMSNIRMVASGGCMLTDDRGIPLLLSELLLADNDGDMRRARDAAVVAVVAGRSSRGFDGFAAAGGGGGG